MLAGCLTYLVHRQRDRVGLIAFDSDIVAHVPPSAKHMDVVLHTLEHTTPEGREYRLDETIAEGWWGPRLDDMARQRLGDVALVASASAARGLAATGARLPIVSIGPQTTQAARDAGFDVVAEAATHDLEGLLTALQSL